MLHRSNKIQWMNVNDSISKIDTIDRLYTEYAHRMCIQSPEKSEIYFGKDSSIKITDMFGWTSIIAIQKLLVSKEWRKINTTINQSIIVHSNTLVPIYDPSKPSRGFHGEVKYPYVFKNPDKILPGDVTRLRDIDNEFFSVDVEKLDDTIDIGNDDFAFEILTESRFCNINRIHMFASNSITIDEALSMGKSQRSNITKF